MKEMVTLIYGVESMDENVPVCEWTEETLNDVDDAIYRAASLKKGMKQAYKVYSSFIEKYDVVPFLRISCDDWHIKCRVERESQDLVDDPLMNMIVECDFQPFKPSKSLISNGLTCAKTWHNPLLYPNLILEN